MIFLILLIITVFNIILRYYLPFTYQNLSFFTPMFLISIMPFLSYYIKDKKTYFLIIVILALIKDILYSEIFLLIFATIFLIGYINYYLNNKNLNIIKLCLFVLSSVIFYDSIIFLISILATNYTYNIRDLLYKISHSIIINITFIIILYIFKKDRINSYNNKRKLKR